VDNDYVVRKLSLFSGIVSVAVGIPGTTGFDTGTVQASVAKTSPISGLWIGPHTAINTTLYIADPTNGNIRVLITPSSQLTNQPTGQPSSQPSSQPSRQPSADPTAQPTRQPSGQPTAQPSFAPYTYDPLAVPVFSVGSLMLLGYNVHRIYYTAYAFTDWAPNSACKIQYVYTNPEASYIFARIVMDVDDKVNTFSLNQKTIYSNAPSGTTIVANVKIRPGDNLFEFTVQNTGTPVVTAYLLHVTAITLHLHCYFSLNQMVRGSSFHQ
jgi:hypothetical protein